MVFDLQKKPYCKEVSSFWKRNFALFDYIAIFFEKGCFGENVLRQRQG